MVNIADRQRLGSTRALCSTPPQMPAVMGGGCGAGGVVGFTALRLGKSLHG